MPICLIWRSQRGFNLIELAIVLGVVGLILGGIWTAAADFREKWAMHRLTTQIMTMADAYGRLVDLRASWGISDNADISSLAINAGISLKTWAYNNEAGQWLFKTEFGLYARLWNGQSCAYRGWYGAYICVRIFRFYLFGVSKAQCIALGNNLSAIAKQSGSTPGQGALIYTLGMAANTYGYDFPIAMSTLIANCINGDTLTIDFPYK